MSDYTVGDFIEGWLYTRIDDAERVEAACQQAEALLSPPLWNLTLTEGLRERLIGEVEGDPDQAPTLRDIIREEMQERGGAALRRQYADRAAKQYPKDSPALQAMRVGPDTPLPRAMAKALRIDVGQAIEAMRGHW